jgi:hypothetical protein
MSRSQILSVWFTVRRLSNGLHCSMVKLCVVDVDPQNAGSVDYDQFLEISKPSNFLGALPVTCIPV